jgi:hypothetical protein
VEKGEGVAGAYQRRAQGDRVLGSGALTGGLRREAADRGSLAVTELRVVEGASTCASGGDACRHR